MNDNIEMLDDVVLSDKKPENNNIGMLPPKKDSKKPINKKKRLLFIIIVIVLILLVGFGVYYYLSMGNSRLKNKVVTKDMVLNIGDELSTDPANYATFNGILSANCYLNDDKVNVEMAGFYTYYIVCGEVSFKGNIEIKDNENPEVETQNLIRNVGEEVSPAEFIVDCKDFSMCSYEFTDKEAVLSLIENVGTYTVTIKVSDSSGNNVIVTPTLEIIESNVVSYLQCAGEVNLTDDGTVTDIDKFPMDEGNNFVGTAKRIKMFSYLKSAKYNEIKESNINATELNGVTGTLSFSDDKYVINVINNLDIETLNKENGNFPLSYNEIKILYESKGYQCYTEEK